MLGTRVIELVCAESKRISRSGTGFELEPGNSWMSIELIATVFSMTLIALIFADADASGATSN